MVLVFFLERIRAHDQETKLFFGNDWIAGGMRHRMRDEAGRRHFQSIRGGVRWFQY
jgi:hypothetical protein